MNRFVQPKTYTFDQHQIPPDKIDPNAHYVIQKLKQAGFSAYLVGGGVRDLLLKSRPKDFDVSTSAKPEEIRSLFRNAILIGRRFRLAHIRFGKNVIEVSTFRSGAPESADLIIRDNVWGTEEEDVLRRDFTINGLFYDPETQTVIDYVGGFDDLGKRILRTIGQPEIRFGQDPVRMIRLLKFCARLNFEVYPPTHLALIQCRDHIIKSSSARILEELLRMLESGFALPFFRLLHQYGLLKLLIAPLAHFIDLDQDQRIYKMLDVVDIEMRKVYPNCPDRSLPLAALCFPILDLTIRHLMKHTDKPLHLGLIAHEANELITNLFSPFFKIPRRLRSQMVFILTAQYRFTPLDNRPIRHPRLPRDEALPLAMQLFKMRTSLQSDLLPLYTLWTEAASQERPVSAEYRHRRRRPRRRKPPAP
jgi:poly(A) polymerase